VFLSDLSPSELAGCLSGPGLYLPVGPFLYHLKSNVSDVAKGIGILYRDFTCSETAEFADFHVSLQVRQKLFRSFRQEVTVLVDGDSPSVPLPVNQAFALFEGVLNWCIYSFAHHYFIVHAAAIERDGLTAILPAPPGSGKSTLCAALVHRGWRLLTDELTLIDPASGLILPLVRPISLKDASLEVIRRFAPGAIVGPVSLNTIKGNIAHLRPPTESVRKMDMPSRPAWFVFPKYRAGAALSATSLSKSQALIRVADSSVNYSILGVDGFKTLSRAIDDADSYNFEYSDLDEAIGWFDSLKRPVAITDTLTV
jgi:HprK-related kinase A